MCRRALPRAYRARYIPARAGSGEHLVFFLLCFAAGFVAAASAADTVYTAPGVYRSAVPSGSIYINGFSFANRAANVTVVLGEGNTTTLYNISVNAETQLILFYGATEVSRQSVKRSCMRCSLQIVTETCRNESSCGYFLAPRLAHDKLCGVDV